MTSDWQELTRMTGDKEFSISRVTLKLSGISIDGEFDLPPMARLGYDDQIFVAEFIRNHGSIKQMEAAFGVSYPTIKARLNKIASLLNLIQIEPAIDREEVLSMLEKGEITAKEAIEKLKGNDYE
jgi:hypothetical protein